MTNHEDSRTQTFELTGDDTYDAFLPVDYVTGDPSTGARLDQVGMIVCRSHPAYCEGDGPTLVDLRTVPDDEMLALWVEAVENGDHDLADTLHGLLQ